MKEFIAKFVCKDDFENFIENHFNHLRGRVDKLYYIVIGALVSSLLTLIGVIITLVIRSKGG